MPILIYDPTDDDGPLKKIAYLCEDEWLLWPQIDVLTDWLDENARSMSPGRYIANVGFRWRHNASSGGPILRAKTMQLMAKIGMDLYLSEYSAHQEETE